jgi:periplasmic protein TonB
MNQHLTSDQILESLVTGAGQQHLNECAACRAELASVARPLGWFRASVHQQNQTSQALAPVLLLPLDRRGRRSRAAASSVFIHAAAVASLFALGTSPAVRQVVKQQIDLIAPDIAPYTPTKRDTMHGGGGGGDRSPTPVSNGNLPKLSNRQFVPPTVKPPDNPKLVMAPTLIIQTDADIPKINTDQLGDPLAKSGLASNGFGSGGGMGNGRGGGVGSGLGPGFGLGSGGNIGGGAYTIGGGVSAPIVIYKVEPEYSEEARKAKFQGSVLLFVIIDEHGNPRNIRVIRPLGLGLDQKAVEAVEKWKFSPGKKDGKPVPVQAEVEVNFRLL